MPIKTHETACFTIKSFNLIHRESFHNIFSPKKVQWDSNVYIENIFFKKDLKFNLN